MEKAGIAHNCARFYTGGIGRKGGGYCQNEKSLPVFKEQLSAQVNQFERCHKTLSGAKR